MRDNPAAVLVAPPGAGKTTAVPLALLKETWLSGRRLLLLAPRRAHMILAARKEKMGRSACEIAAILSERDPLHFSGRERDAALRLRLDALQAYRAKRPFHMNGCSVDSSAARQILKVSAVLQQRLDISKKNSAAAVPGRLLAWAYPDRIARRRPDSPGRFLLSSGIDILPWTRTLRTWQSRVMLLARIDADGGPWPDVCDAALYSTKGRYPKHVWPDDPL